jgi:hypothetical protein
MEKELRYYRAAEGIFPLSLQHNPTINRIMKLGPIPIAAITGVTLLSCLAFSTSGFARSGDAFMPEEEPTTEGLTQTDPLRVIVVTRTSVGGKPIPGVSVTNLATGEMVVSDLDGEAAFVEQTYPLGLLRLVIDHPDSISRFISRELPPEVCGSGCGDQDWTLDVSIDPIDWLISPPVGINGAQHFLTVPTGIVRQGEASQYLQDIEAIVPANAWAGTYRIGFTPMRNSSFNYSDYGVPEVKMYPVGGVTFQFLDPVSKLPVAGEPILEPVVLRMDPAFIMDLAQSPTSIQAWRVDHTGIDFTSNGVVSTELVNGKIELKVDQPGTYQVFAGEELQPLEMPMSAGPIRWQECGFTWRRPCAIEGSDGVDLPIFGCTTYTAGQAEELSTDEAQTKEKTTKLDLKLTAEAKAKLPFIGGVEFEVSVEHETQWVTKSTWSTKTVIGTRSYSPPMWGTSCITVMEGTLTLCEVVGTHHTEGGECSFTWTPTGNTQEVYIIGPTCIADELSDTPPPPPE